MQKFLADNGQNSPCGVGRVDRASFSDVLGLGFNHAPSENTTSLPRSPRGSPRSRAYYRISELNEGGGVKQKMVKKCFLLKELLSFD